MQAALVAIRLPGGGGGRGSLRGGRGGRGRWVFAREKMKIIHFLIFLEKHFFT